MEEHTMPEAARQKCDEDRRHGVYNNGIKWMNV